MRSREGRGRKRTNLSRDGSVHRVRKALRQRRINAVGVKDMTAGLATKVVAEGLVGWRSDRRTGRTACGTAEQATKDGASDDAQRMTGTLSVSLGEGGRGTLNCPSDATEGCDRGLRATARYKERGVATRAGDGHMRTMACCAEAALLLPLPLADRNPIRNTMANATRHSSTG